MTGRDVLFISQANAFLDYLEGHADPACSLQEAAHTLRTNLATLASVDERAWQILEKRH